MNEKFQLLVALVIVGVYMRVGVVATILASSILLVLVLSSPSRSTCKILVILFQLVR